MDKLKKEIARREASFRALAARARAKGDITNALHYDEIANEMKSLLDLANATGGEKETRAHTD
ncbi:MAG TPA: hypothetical protein PLD20_00840 [Blastocatellia bacterium]|nr:hypothetical protein [Blastocatellia bacterium]HMV81793.1 hypothetical protein [Blastocatellia bacterium]HMY70692.1 hypothetical protein [Blastocatellia bacterium]HMZ16481.1 hypothetical protein [Blastocatellia bacterium]HNG29470.1 hypothetical protein [Blastocatellia bacterium]